ncbi:MAG: methylthioribulose 1-phosphate dehydratase [Woeseia sp.]
MMSTNRFTEQAEALRELCRLFGERQWCLATSGNFSVRAGASRCLITQSGKDKTKLAVDDLMLCDLDGVPAANGDKGFKPSAETLLHTCLYRLDDRIAAVLHTHSVAATVLSRIAGAELDFSGFEMQKAIAGIGSHDAMVALPVFENTQDMSVLADAVRRRAADGTLSVPGFLVRGHGLYAWGTSLTEAQRHIEGFEFLLSCTLQERLLNR